MSDQLRFRLSEKEKDRRLRELRGRLEQVMPSTEQPRRRSRWTLVFLAGISLALVLLIVSGSGVLSGLLRAMK
jgi:uncharacterized membrane protein YjjP (DUF1212 family)